MPTVDGFSVGSQSCLPMSDTAKTDSVRFTAKGQVVIPAWLRRQFQIEDGTKAVVHARADGILLTPVTPALVRRARGILKRQPGGKPFAEEWAEHKRRERSLGERRVG